jgi:DNA-binding IclR family transcriptional regulator
MLNAPRHAILEALSQRIGETCNFGVMADSHVVYLDRVESAWPFGLRFEPGSRVPLHCT